MNNKSKKTEPAKNADKRCESVGRFVEKTINKVDQDADAIIERHSKLKGRILSGKRTKTTGRII